MNNPNYFTAIAKNKKILGLIAILFILLCSLAQFASFALIQNYVVGSFGAQPEEVSVALQICYVGILSILPIQFRFQQYFHTRHYLLAALALGIILNVGCLNTNDILIFILFRFFQGVVTGIIAGNMLMMLFSTLPKENSMVTGSSIFFGFILVSGVLIGIADAWITLRADWKSIYYILIAMQLFSMLFCFAFFNTNTLRKKYPLYQIDWKSSIIFIGFASTLLCIMVYGPKLYWFNSNKILYATYECAFLLILLIYRQFTTKRPMLYLRVFSYKKFLLGIVLLAIFYGSKDSINLIYNYASGILGWNTWDVIMLGCFNVLGVLIGSSVSAFALIKDKHNVPKLILLGFCIMLSYHLNVYWLMTPNLSFLDMIAPVALQGLASGILFVPVIMMCLGSLPPAAGVTGIIICGYVRFVATLNGITGYYSLQLQYNQMYKLSFLTHITQTDFQTAQRLTAYQNLFQSNGYTASQSLTLANTLLSKTVSQQGQLLTIKSVFFAVATLLIMTIVMQLIFMAGSKVKIPKSV